MLRELNGATHQCVALSVIVPVYNEAATLAEHMHELARTLDALPDAPVWELLLVDDGSNDGSLGSAMRLATEDPRVAVCMHDRNYGIARALATGCAQARGEYVIVLDADLSYGPGQVAVLWSAALTSGADIVVASAFMRGGKVRNVPALRKWLSASANWFLSLASRGRVCTLTCMVRIYRTDRLREMIDHVQADAMLPDLLLNALQHGASIVEIPATLEWRPGRRPQNRFKAQSAVRYALAILRCGLRRRPALWLAVPGLVPGLLPVVAAALFFLHISPPMAAAVLAVTIVVQYASLLVLGWQGFRFLSRRAQRC